MSMVSVENSLLVLVPVSCRDAQVVSDCRWRKAKKYQTTQLVTANAIDAPADISLMKRDIISLLLYEGVIVAVSPR